MVIEISHRFFLPETPVDYRQALDILIIKFILLLNKNKNERVMMQRLSLSGIFITVKKVTELFTELIICIRPGLSFWGMNASLIAVGVKLIQRCIILHVCRPLL